MLSRLISRSLPDGFLRDQTVFYTGATETFESGDQIVYGRAGTVSGPSMDRPAKRVAVRFEGNARPIDCWISELVESAKDVPALPGGFKVDDPVYFSGASRDLGHEARLLRVGQLLARQHYIVSKSILLTLYSIQKCLLSI